MPFGRAVCHSVSVAYLLVFTIMQPPTRVRSRAGLLLALMSIGACAAPSAEPARAPEHAAPPRGRPMTATAPPAPVKTEPSLSTESVSRWTVTDNGTELHQYAIASYEGPLESHERLDFVLERRGSSVVARGTVYTNLGRRSFVLRGRVGGPNTMALREPRSPPGLAPIELEGTVQTNGSIAGTLTLNGKQQAVHVQQRAAFAAAADATFVREYGGSLEAQGPVRLRLRKDHRSLAGLIRLEHGTDDLVLEGEASDSGHFVLHARDRSGNSAGTMVGMFVDTRSARGLWVGTQPARAEELQFSEDGSWYTETVHVEGARIYPEYAEQRFGDNCFSKTETPRVAGLRDARRERLLNDVFTALTAAPLTRAECPDPRGDLTQVARVSRFAVTGVRREWVGLWVFKRTWPGEFRREVTCSVVDLRTAELRTPYEALTPSGTRALEALIRARIDAHLPAQPRPGVFGPTFLRFELTAQTPLCLTSNGLSVPLHGLVPDRYPGESSRINLAAEQVRGLFSEPYASAWFAPQGSRTERAR